MLHILLGGFGIEVGLDQEVELFEAPHLGPLFPEQAPKTEPDMRVQVSHEDRYPELVQDFHQRTSFFETPTAWRICDEGERYHFGPVANCDFEPILPHVLASKDFSKLHVLSPAKLIHNAYPLDEIIADHFLALREGIIVHASGLKINGQGVLFLGDSGAGKSTIAEFFVNEYGKDAILCDDRMIIRYVNKRWMVYGSPWHGTYNHFTTQGVPLKAMYFIEQAKNHRTLPVEQSKIFERLTRVSFVCWWLRQFSCKQMQTIQSIVMDPYVTTKVLEFSKEPSIVNFLRPSL